MKSPCSLIYINAQICVCCVQVLFVNYLGGKKPLGFFLNSSLLRGEFKLVLLKWYFFPQKSKIKLIKNLESTEKFKETKGKSPRISLPGGVCRAKGF